ncbi:MAG: hypothetical protein ABEI31_07225 [Halodesulfurarchaeum sp.]
MGEDPDRPETAATRAMERRLAEVDGDPTCTHCGGEADFFLFEPDRVATFVCWEHVSPLSAAIDVPVAESERPVAVPLSEEFS